MCVIVVGKQQIIFIHTKYQIPTKSNQIKLDFSTTSGTN